MKRIRILAVLVGVVFLFTGLRGGVQGVIDGWNEAGDNREFNFPTSVSVKADKTVAADSLFNSEMKQQIPYRIEALQTDIDVSVWSTVLDVAMFPIALLCLYGVYCMARMVVSVTRKEVFTRKNVKRLRIFIYVMILTGIFMELRHYCQYCDIVSQIHLSGYAIEPYSLKSPWAFFLLFALFTEIFAVGVKIKEEQDLTI